MRTAFTAFALTAAMELAACGSRSALSGVDGGRGAAGTSGVAPVVDGPAGAEGGTDAASSGDDAGAADRPRDAMTLPDGRCAVGAFPRDGVCMCQTSLPNVCDDRCVDLQNDDDHCGRCGNACDPTSTCAQGVCTPPPVVVVAARPGCNSLDIAVVGDDVYWSDAGHGRVARTAAGLGSPSQSDTIAQGESAPEKIVVGGRAVFWIGGHKKEIRRGALGQPPVTVATSLTDIHGLTVTSDGSTVYFSVESSVRKVAATGGLTVEVAHDEFEGVPSALALDGDKLAYTDGNNGMVEVVTLVEGQLALCNVFDGAEVVNVNCLRVAQGQGSLLEQALGTWRGQVLWADGAVLKGARTTGSLHNVGQYQVGVTPLDPITGFAVSEGRVAFSSNDGNQRRGGEILQAPIEVGWPAGRLARGLEAPRAVVASGERIFWATGGCAIQGTKFLRP
jgi:hypothetical protein